MPLPDHVSPSPEEAPAANTRIVITKVFVRGLEVDAQIGVYKHEKGRLQRLVLDVELDVAVTDWTDLSATVNYEVIAEKARRVAAEAAHVPLGRQASPYEIAQALVYLIDAPSVTGQMIAVDGGQHLAWKTPDIIDP